MLALEYSIVVSVNIVALINGNNIIRLLFDYFTENVSLVTCRPTALPYLICLLGNFAVT